MTDLRYQRVYYVRGASPKHWTKVYHIGSPPNSGSSRALVIGEGKWVVLFCPYTLHSYRIPSDAGELGTDEPDLLEDSRDFLVDCITRKWRLFVGVGITRDFDVAAMVLVKLGAEVPTDLPEVEGAEPKRERRGGKPHARALIKPVGRATKRGRVAEFFRSDELKSLRECMAKLEMSRNSVVSALHNLHVDHGLGYELVNDTARLLAPKKWKIFKG